MRWRIFPILVFLSVVGATEMQAQRQKKRPAKDNTQVTPENAAEQDHKNQEEKVGQYRQKKDYHQKNQDKETRKRMKKNLKRAEKHSWGKDVPWYKRWFRKKRMS